MSAFPYPVPTRLLDAIEENRDVVLATHENPDADGLGSLLALGLALAERGRRVWRLEEGVVPAALRELPGYDRIPVYGATDPAVDFVILFDCHRRARLGAAAERVASASLFAAVDHHPRDPRGVDVELLWLLEDAPSTTMMVHSLLRAMHDVPLDAAKASNLYAGLLTDTGGFRHANTTRDALLAAADLVHAGADARALAESLMHRVRPEGLRMTGEVLLGTQYHAERRIAVMVVDRDLMERTRTAIEETEQLASLLTGIEGVEVGVLLKETEPRHWRVSLRANGEHRVDEVARGFGGGGHRRAAAFTASGSRDEVEENLVRALERVLSGEGTR